MTKMAKGFRSKLEQMLKSGKSLSPRSLIGYLLTRLQKITERDVYTYELFMRLTQQVSVVNGNVWFPLHVHVHVHVRPRHTTDANSVSRGLL